MSLITILLILIVVGFTGFWASVFIFEKIEYSWLPQLCRWLVISLPFERIPSLNTPIGNIRISQVLVLIGFWFLILLFLKKDSSLRQKSFNTDSIYLILFIIYSSFSWLQVINFNRFLSTYIATLLSFGGFFLLSQFTENIFKRIQELMISFLAVGFFGVYQFLGDMVGIPPLLTGLRENYTKIVFGIPRIHATAIEPLYFAGMLFLPIFACLTFILARKKILNKHFRYSNFAILIFFVALFVLTLSKGAWLTLAIVLPFFFLLAARKFKIWELLKSLSWLGFVSVIGFLFSLLYSETIWEFTLGFWQHLIATIDFTAATSFERLSLLGTAWIILQDYILTGIGSGQYGIYSQDLLIGLEFEPGNFAIVNNVYLEIWLEFGLVSLWIFLIFIFTPVFRSLKKLFQPGKITSEDEIAQFILVFSLISYYIQWSFFSPIFIMPIFILLGLLSRLTYIDKTAKLSENLN